MNRKNQVLREFNRPYFEIDSNEIKRALVSAMFTLDCIKRGEKLPSVFNGLDKEEAKELAENAIFLLTQELQHRN